MNTSRLSPNDPRLTAYALGELDASEAEHIAALVGQDPGAQAVVEEIRALAGQLEEVLENEPIVAEPTSPSPVSVGSGHTSNIIRFPLYWASGLAAACLLLVLVSQRSGNAPTLAAATSTKESVRPTSSTAVEPSTGERATLPMADMRKRALTPAGSDVSPAPLREDGLKVGRTVADASRPVQDELARSGKSTTAKLATEVAQPVGPAAPHDSTYGSVALQTRGSLRPSHDYSPSLNYGTRRNVSDAPALAVSRTGQSPDTFFGLPGLPLSGSYAAFRNAQLSKAETSDIARTNDSQGDEFLAAGLTYEVPAISSSHKIELPSIEAGKISITSKDFKLGTAGNGFGLVQKDPSGKGSATYDQILKWAQEAQENKDDAVTRKDALEPVKNPKSATVE